MGPFRSLFSVRCKQDFTLSHEFLAVMLGVQRPTVSVVAETLQHAGLIKYRHGCVTVTNRAGMETAAGECCPIIRRHFDSLRQQRAPVPPPFCPVECSVPDGSANRPVDNLAERGTPHREAGASSGKSSCWETRPERRRAHRHPPGRPLVLIVDADADTRDLNHTALVSADFETDAIADVMDGYMRAWVRRTRVGVI